MRNAVLAERAVRERSLAGLGLEQTKEIVVMPGNALAVAPQLAPDLVPSLQPVKNDDLVPEGALGIDDGYVWYGQVDIRNVGGHIGRDRSQRMRIERRFGTRFNLHGLGDITVGRGRARVDQQQRLPVVRIRLHTQGVRFHARARGGFGADRSEALRHFAVDICLAGVADRIERGHALLSVEPGKFLDRSRMAEVVAEYRHIDVFGEAFDQAEALGKRRAALEQQPRPVGHAVEQGVERPAEPELPEHEDVAPAPRPLRNEFDFDDPPDDQEATTNRRIVDQMRANARRAALDPSDGIDL